MATATRCTVSDRASATRCAEQINYPRELAEAALAHVLKDKTEAAYQRGDLFEKRRKLMRGWAGDCTSPPWGEGEIVPMAGERQQERRG